MPRIEHSRLVLADHSCVAYLLVDGVDQLFMFTDAYAWRDVRTLLEQDSVRTGE